MIIKSLEHLQLISSKLADMISEKDCIFLVGEIGVGKTTFTRCFINYLQKKSNIEPTEVLSPTFNLLYEYEINKLKVKHYDLYRIKDSKELDLLDIFKDDLNSIKIIEWPELIKANLKDKLELHLKHSDKANERELILVGNGKWKDIDKHEL